MKMNIRKTKVRRINEREIMEVTKLNKMEQVGKYTYFESSGEEWRSNT